MSENLDRELLRLVGSRVLKGPAGIYSAEQLRKQMYREPSFLDDKEQEISMIDLPSGIVDRLGHDGVPNNNKLFNFLSDANACLDAGFEVGDILGMDPGACIDKKGRILRGRLMNMRGIEKHNV